MGIVEITPRIRHKVLSFLTGVCVRILTVILMITLFCGSVRAEDVPAMPGGPYRLDNRHTSITFKISHLGFSHFTGRFDQVEGSFDFNPAAPEQSALMSPFIPTASIPTMPNLMTICAAKTGSIRSNFRAPASALPKSN